MQPTTSKQRTCSPLLCILTPLESSTFIVWRSSSSSSLPGGEHSKNLMQHDLALASPLRIQCSSSKKGQVFQSFPNNDFYATACLYSNRMVLDLLLHSMEVLWYPCAVTSFAITSKESIFLWLLQKVSWTFCSLYSVRRWSSLDNSKKPTCPGGFLDLVSSHYGLQENRKGGSLKTMGLWRWDTGAPCQDDTFLIVEF